jgi:short-subunit dehydrogenase
VSALDGHAVLITGASAGIGAASARRLAAEGARLALAARRADLLESVAEECRSAGSPEVLVRPIDLSDVDAAERLALEIDDALTLTGVVNNAGIPKRLNVQKLPYTDVAHVMTVNYLSPVRIMLALIPRMVARGRGTFVNIASVAGRIGSPQESAYSGSKFALTGFSEAAHVDLAGTGVVMRVVQPGPIETPIWGEIEGNDPPIYDGPMYPADDVAAAVLDALTGEKFEYFVPADLHGAVAFKSSDIDAFLSGSIAFLTRTEAPADVVDRIPDSVRGGTS